MSRRRKTLLLVLLLAIVALLIFGAAHRVRVEGSLAGRTISAVSGHLLSGATLAIHREEAKVTLGEMTATITATHVRLPDGRSLPIPAACRRIEIEEYGDALLVRFDGVEAP